MRQTKLTKAARGRECQVRIPGICNGNPETTVLAHYRMAGTCGACSTCHDVCDGRSKAIDRETARRYHAEGVMRTQAILLAEAVVVA
ncbi:DUF1364 domain-containing protein [Pseudomonas juntendi]|uniref:DUF1364 domain-containing protein n=1 Tax=Pseudomonas juntendi TaxID=2666183 RepID=UPI001F3D5C49|nr:DUF1364 domain-containing protein [Pseudomonas juntendi]MCO7055054.1 DUF1364 domain-containing protein [Pseudomonas juntendi]UJM10728.1 DUF1364 domain-containing protein [Pseudomonas juntendi]UXA40664.1 DUF1364 domain-containing protein [Pseudomonas juntendi]